jgi:purine-binding chemotaxis protein CheW
MALQKIIAIEIGGQWLAIPALKIIDVVRTPATTRIPCIKPWIAGVQNLRGRLVTALDLYAWLDLQTGDNIARMSIILQFGIEHYSLLANKIGDVFDISTEDVKPNPRSLSVGWSEISDGVIELPGIGLVMMVSVDRLLGTMTKLAA